ncbi:AlpA family phage regulatory protein [Methylosinus sporium]|uniref:AlpA family phage regulatory protein n=1 Tax=Methylosinus sporium TaxID=428 RepID=A0A549T5Q4_METSR|nr:AlpA family transcriptional regulator [Methylosinus sp. KRF6]TRL37208.1 AlpA family phage regulatory protein [Methylosinus sporium]
MQELHVGPPSAHVLGLLDAHAGEVGEGTFPPQIRISVNGAGWRESDINRWVANPVAWRPGSGRDLDGV